MKEKIDRQIVGIVLGLVLPPVTTFVFYSVRHANDMSYWEFIRVMLGMQMLGKLVSICVLPSLLVFLVALKTNCLWIVRGIIIGTVGYALAAAVLALIK